MNAVRPRMPMTSRSRPASRQQLEDLLALDRDPLVHLEHHRAPRIGEQRRGTCQGRHLRSLDVDLHEVHLPADLVGDRVEASGGHPAALVVALLGSRGIGGGDRRTDLAHRDEQVDLGVGGVDRDRDDPAVGQPVQGEVGGQLVGQLGHRLDDDDLARGAHEVGQVDGVVAGVTADVDDRLPRPDEPTQVAHDRVP